MNFLASNLSYEYDTGVESVLSMLEAVVRKFPNDIVHEYADLFFLSLVCITYFLCVGMYV